MKRNFFTLSLGVLITILLLVTAWNTGCQSGEISSDNNVFPENEDSPISMFLKEFYDKKAKENELMILSFAGEWEVLELKIIPRIPIAIHSEPEREILGKEIGIDGKINVTLNNQVYHIAGIEICQPIDVSKYYNLIYTQTILLEENIILLTFKDDSENYSHFEIFLCRDGNAYIATGEWFNEVGIYLLNRK